MNATCLLSTTYFGPIQWYQKLCRYDRVLIEHHESYQKQTYRNRCLIATAQGVQALTVPVCHDERLSMKDEKYDYPVNGESMDSANHLFHLSPLISDLLVSDHGNWRHLHWQALQSAYGDSPFFEHYEDDLRPFFTERRWERLIDFNTDICLTMCRLLDIHPNLKTTENYSKNSDFIDFRDAIRPKHPAPDPDFQPRRYWQVFEQKHGFMPNLSILDLLFNMGPESIFFL